MDMLKSILLLLLISSASTLYGQEDLKFWDKNSPVEWSDYKAKERPKNLDPKGVASTRCGEIYRYKRIGEDSSINVFKFEVKAVMYRNGSWANPIGRTPYLLKHERLHFDISEFFARQLLSAFNSSTYSKNFQVEIKEMRQKLRVQENAMQNLYDQQAQHGLRENMQYAWEFYIGDLLAGNYTLEQALKKQPVVDQEYLVNKNYTITPVQKKSVISTLEGIEQKYGFQAHSKFLVKVDSADVLKVTDILDHYGWLGIDQVSQL